MSNKTDMGGPDERGPFERELEALLNTHSAENLSDTPDFILARYMSACLAAFNGAVNRREKWYGRAKRGSENE